jgi:hypothetical protein
VPLHGPNGSVVGYYDHEAAKAGLQITAKYAEVAPFFSAGGWLEAFPAKSPTVFARAISDSIDEAIHQHHVWAKYLGGPHVQEREALRQSLHIEVHGAIRTAMKEAGFPLNVGGKGGSTADWAQYFQEHPGRFDKAMDVVRQVSRDFDRKYGTSMAEKLDNELRKAGHLNDRN